MSNSKFPSIKPDAINQLYQLLLKKRHKDVVKLVKLYERVLHGEDSHMGLFDCYDTYYKGCWDEDLAKIEMLKEDLNIK